MNRIEASHYLYPACHNFLEEDKAKLICLSLLVAALALVILISSTYDLQAHGIYFGVTLLIVDIAISGVLLYLYNAKTAQPSHRRDPDKPIQNKGISSTPSIEKKIIVYKWEFIRKNIGQNQLIELNNRASELLDDENLDLYKGFYTIQEFEIQLNNRKKIVEILTILKPTPESNKQRYARDLQRARDWKAENPSGIQLLVQEEPMYSRCKTYYLRKGHARRFIEKHLSGYTELKK